MQARLPRSSKYFWVPPTNPSTAIHPPLICVPVHVESSLQELMQPVLLPNRQFIFAFDTLQMLQDILDALEDQPAVAVLHSLTLSIAAARRTMAHLRLWKLQALLQFQRALNDDFGRYRRAPLIDIDG